MNRTFHRRLRAFAADLDRAMSALEAEERARYVDLHEAVLAVVEGRAPPGVLRDAPGAPPARPERPHGLRLVPGDRAPRTRSWRAYGDRSWVGAVPVTAADRESARLEREADRISATSG